MSMQRWAHTMRPVVSQYPHAAAIPLSTIGDILESDWRKIFQSSSADKNNVPQEELVPLKWGTYICSTYFQNI